jgi:4-amino-4-deoxy-L-arabinose transferase-like glycosyltransferase
LTTPPLLPQNTYRVLFLLLGIVYLIGLFVPLMDNDSAHHAVIAMHMHLTGNYVSLIDAGVPYLDKPHFHFWMAALAYKILGVTTYAYKLPSFLFTILGTYATYRLGKTLYNGEAGKLAALMAGSALAYMLANMDVRMDAILTASVALSSWQLAAWIDTKNWRNALGAALALAIGFSTKGHIGVVTPAAGAFFYILYKRNWRTFYHPHLLLIIAAFAAFISPVVYAYYLQYDLHPETVVRGRNNISGVKFILWQQNTERFEGDAFGSDAKNDYFFFFHSFLWAFAPWSVLAFIAMFNRIKKVKARRWEWFTLGTIIPIALILTFSGFKLPHYLNIIFPAAAVLTAGWIQQLVQEQKGQKPYAITQVVVCSLLLVAVALLNVWAFPVYELWIVIGVLMMGIVTYLLLKNSAAGWPRIIAGSVLSSVLVWFLLNSNFYPKLLTYQAGNELAQKVVQTIGGANVYQQPGLRSFSFDFYTQTLAKPLADSAFRDNRPVWLLVDSAGLKEARTKYNIGSTIRHRDFSVTQLNGTFINPATRQKALSELILAEVLKPKKD